MSEFVGRTGSLRVYSYPETRRAGSAADAFARNYATGAKGIVTIPGGGMQVTWAATDVGPDNDEDVQITPAVTGVILVSGVLTLNNPTGAPIDVNITVQVEDAPNLSTSSQTTIPAGDDAAIPFLYATDPLLPLNAPYNIQVFVTGTGAVLAGAGCVMNLQEVSVATG